MLSPSLGRAGGACRFVPRRRREAVAEGQDAPRSFWNDFFGGAPARAMEAGHARRGASRPRRTADAPAAASAGHVALVGAGPGAEDLLTLRAQRLLMEADVIVHDALVPEAVVAMGRRDAERLPVGKRKGCHSKSQAEINALLVELGREGKRVVRLKSGDPLVFGRAGEEMQALRDAGISYEVVPGVTAAFAAAADFELPLTLRGVSSSMVFTTGHDLQGRHAARLGAGWPSPAPPSPSIWAARSPPRSPARLIEAGLSPDTAVAVVENASLADRRLFHGTLADLPSLEARADLTGPVMTIIGDAVAGANFEHSEPLAAHSHAGRGRSCGRRS